MLSCKSEENMDKLSSRCVEWSEAGRSKESANERTRAGRRSKPLCTMTWIPMVGRSARYSYMFVLSLVSYCEDQNLVADSCLWGQPIQPKASTTTIFLGQDLGSCKAYSLFRKCTKARTNLLSTICWQVVCLCMKSATRVPTFLQTIRVVRRHLQETLRSETNLSLYPDTTWTHYKICSQWRVPTRIDWQLPLCPSVCVFVFLYVCRGSLCRNPNQTLLRSDHLHPVVSQPASIVSLPASLKKK